MEPKKEHPRRSDGWGRCEFNLATKIQTDWEAFLVCSVTPTAGGPTVLCCLFVGLFAACCWNLIISPWATAVGLPSCHSCTAYIIKALLAGSGLAPDQTLLWHADPPPLPHASPDLDEEEDGSVFTSVCWTSTHTDGWRLAPATAVSQGGTLSSSGWCLIKLFFIWF